jgi:hypothetical protein
MKVTENRYEPEYILHCVGSPVCGGRRIWGCGCVYENDKIYILFEDRSDRIEIIPNTLSVKLMKRTEKFAFDHDRKNHLYEYIGPM